MAEFIETKSGELREMPDVVARDPKLRELWVTDPDEAERQGAAAEEAFQAERRAEARKRGEEIPEPPKPIDEKAREQLVKDAGAHQARLEEARRRAARARDGGAEPKPAKPAKTAKGE